MKYKFSDSASGPARFVSKDEVMFADVTFGSVRRVGGNKNRLSRVSNNLEAFADILRDTIGVSKEEFYMVGNFRADMSNRIARGMGLER